MIARKEVRARRTAGLLLALFFLFSPLLTEAVQPSGNEHQLKVDKHDGYVYRYVTNDPLGVRIYTLSNGLKVYLSKNEQAPSINTRIAIDAGAQDDPDEATGLAHYLEHIMFKGTDEFGTQNWSKEKELLDSLETMYEQYGTLDSEKSREAFYDRIDAVSQEASKYAIPNEYDRMMSALGASGTNAYTNFDQTVYVNTIPSNQLENWLEIESERFSQIVPRLFHTELETVYEEKNRMGDQRRALQTLQRALFEEHPYGTHTVIGTVEDLKNPSIKEIKAFFDEYYVPNNAAIILSGDIEYERTIELIDRYFGDWKVEKDIQRKKHSQESTLEQPEKKEVVGPSSERVVLSYRLPAQDTEEYLTARMVNMILSSEVGLINMNLNQQQRVQGASANLRGMQDYSLHTFYGMPKRDQSLKEVENLLLEQIEKIKQGEFENWLLDALIADLKKSRMERMNENQYRTSRLVTAFTKGISREEQLREIDFLEQLTKQEIAEFAKQHYRQNYAVVYKKKGELDAPKVEKPDISKVTLNKEIKSDFHKDILDNEVDPIEPEFLNFKEDISKTKVDDNVELLHVKNDLNELFTLNFEIEKGSANDPELNLAAQYIDYLGAGNMSADEFKNELFRLGCDFSVRPHNDHTAITIRGIDEHFEEALDLIITLFDDPGSNPQALEQLKKRILTSRSNNKRNERAIRSKLSQYVMYGPPNSQVKSFLTEKELDRVTSEQLIEKIRNLPGYNQHVEYYGPRSADDVASVVQEYIEAETLKKVDNEPERELNSVQKPAVYWVNYDKVQADILLYFKGEKFSRNRLAGAQLFNTYFGGGMSSVLFQELREAQGLAYSVGASYRTASELGESDYFTGFMGTQADKLSEALPAFKSLLNNLKKSDTGFEAAKQSVLKNIQTQRIQGMGKIRQFENAREMGVNYDIRRTIYEDIQKMRFQDIARFHREHIKNRDMAVMVVGSKDRIDFEVLEKIGPVQKLDLSEIFGY